MVDFFSGIADFLGSSAGQNLIGAGINVGSRLLSTADTTSSNAQAAQQATQGMQRGADTMTDAYGRALPQYTDAMQRALEAYIAGQREATGTFNAGQRAATGAFNTGADAAGSRIDTITAAAEPAIMGLRQTSGANPHLLTPEQQIAYNDAKRRAATGLATGGLRGSGRANAAVLADMEGRVRAGMVGENTRRQDSARTLLANQGFQGTRDRANLDVQRGSVAAGAEHNMGTFGANAARDIGTMGATTARDIGTRTGDSTIAAARGQAAAQEGSGVIGANATTANAGVRANATGDIGNIFAQTARSLTGPTRPYYSDTPTARYNNSGTELYGPGFRRGGRVVPPRPSSIDSIRPQQRAA